uniref:Uncharacterized protein n=1 Tax=Pseudomonas fluorescens (strain SBW25) TaxID=216595 RepID=A0A0G4E5H6_PSEFS|nr:hypothetical protein [Pseudomonas fluorescens]CEK42232.1 hypothetical protein PQBR57_0279 [Pseudomonas fluorescens SBW25]
MEIEAIKAAGSNEPLNIEALNLGHPGTYLSGMQAPVSDAVSRRQTRFPDPVQRGYLKPTPWPSK